MAIRILKLNKDYVLIPLIKGGMAKAIIWPGMGAKFASMHYVEMKPGEENILHMHEYSEDVFYVVQGRGVVVDGNTGKEYPFEKGNFVYVEPGTIHAVKSFGPENFISVGGPAPPDTDLYIKAGLIKKGGNETR